MTDRHGPGSPTTAAYSAWGRAPSGPTCGSSPHLRVSSPSVRQSGRRPTEPRGHGRTCLMGTSPARSPRVAPFWRSGRSDPTTSGSLVRPPGIRPTAEPGCPPGSRRHPAFRGDSSPSLRPAMDTWPWVPGRGGSFGSRRTASRGLSGAASRRTTGMQPIGSTKSSPWAKRSSPWGRVRRTSQRPPPSFPRRRWWPRPTAA